MGRTPVEAEAASHVIRIWEVNKDRLESMHKKIQEPPRLLSKSAGKKSCCIFRVPQSFVEVHGKSYEPHIVSIGPYHHGEDHVKMIQEHKWRYLGNLLNRLKNAKGLGLEDFLKAVEPLEMKARECYSETIHLDTDEFVELLVLDGIFLIELFRLVAGLVAVEANDPLISVTWILSSFYKDFLRLENQIPFFVLECLFDLSKLPGEESGHTLATLALGFFNNTMLRPYDDIANYKYHEGVHLLDLVRSSFIPSDLAEPRRDVISVTHTILPISKLLYAGINFNAAPADSFLAVKFRNGAFEMPSITIDDFMTCFLVNSVAYEQCHSSCSKHFSVYASLLGCLVNTSTDVEHLCDRNIITNYLGKPAEVERFIYNLEKDVTFDVDRCYLSSLFKDVHDYYCYSWRVQWAVFKYSYRARLQCGAVILLFLTVAQTFFTIYSAVRPQN